MGSAATPTPPSCRTILPAIIHWPSSGSNVSIVAANSVHFRARCHHADATSTHIHRRRHRHPNITGKVVLLDGGQEAPVVTANGPHLPLEHDRPMATAL